VAPRSSVITSFSPAGWHLYGFKFLETYRAHCRAPLIVYYEDGQPDVHKYRDEGVTWLPLSMVAHHDAFMERLQFPMMHGNVGGRYDINYDARQVRKTLMLSHAVLTHGGKVFWLDADMVVHSDVPEDFLDRMLPDDKLSCYLGRDYMYTESGFLGINAEHPKAQRFVGYLREMALSGAFLTLQGWHDCYIYDFVRKHYPAELFVNLSADVPKVPGLHPFVHTELGKYFDHLKGNRKQKGFSPEHPVKWHEPAERVEA
jgi:hypothetical protein